MKNIVHDRLSKIDDHLLSIQKNVDNNFYELEIGLRPSWVFKATNEIGCEVTHETEGGNIVRVFSKSEDVVIDDLIHFVEKIIETNKKIAEMEEAFQKKLEEQKKMLESQIRDFQDQLEKVKDISFDDQDEEQEVEEESNDSTQLSNEEKEQLEERIS